MAATLLRPAVTCLVLAVSFSALYLTTGKYDPARLESRARKGEADAQYRLGKACFDGTLREKNETEAAKWFRKAAEQGHADSQAALGLMYAQGSSMRRDYAEAAKWFRKAADQRSAAAQNQLGVLYAQGKGVEQNFDAAIGWFRKAAAQGYKTPRMNLTLALLARSGTTARLETVNGKVYTAARVAKVEPDGVTVAFDPGNGGFGIAKLRFAVLPIDMQEHCGVNPKEPAPQETGFSPLICVASQPL